MQDPLKKFNSILNRVLQKYSIAEKHDAFNSLKLNPMKRVKMLKYKKINRNSYPFCLNKHCKQCQESSQSVCSILFNHGTVTPRRFVGQLVSSINC